MRWLSECACVWEEEWKGLVTRGETMPLHFLQNTGRGRSRLLSSWLALGWLSHKNYPCAIISLSSSMNLWEGTHWGSRVVPESYCSPVAPPILQAGLQGSDTWLEFTKLWGSLLVWLKLLSSSDDWIFLLLVLKLLKFSATTSSLMGFLCALSPSFTK